MLGVALLTAQVRALEAVDKGEARPMAGAGLSSGLRRAGWALLALITLQIALGGWVSTNYAVLACSEVPLCQGQWWPEMDFATGFHLLRPLGGDGQGAFISLAGLTAIHMVHRLAAVLVLLALLAYGAALRRAPWPGRAAQMLQREGLILWGLALWQLASGLSNVVLGWPLVAALAHTLGAALLVWRLVHLLASPAAMPTVVRGSGVAPRSGPQGLHAGAGRVRASS
jgi:cytochrome c oxidase assembly protein subunit 15